MDLRRFFSYASVALVAALLSIGLQAYAFTQPASAPPTNDAYAPINTGGTAQSKTGGLLLNTGGASNGLLVQYGNVGIGTTNPGTKLDVSGQVRSTTGGFVFPDGSVQTTAAGSGSSLWASSGSGIYNTNSGNVGIGTASPGAKLDVEGGGVIFGTSGSSSNTRTLTIMNQGSSQVNFGSYPGQWSPALQIQNNDASRYVWISPLDSASGGNARLVTGGTNFDILPGNTQAATFTTGGNVGIGTTNPGAKLDVNGLIRNSAPSQGTIELSGLLPGYPDNTYPTLKTSGSVLYFSAGGAYSGYMRSGSIAFPQFRDYDNEAYYVDPASTSVINVLQTSSGAAGIGYGNEMWTPWINYRNTGVLNIGNGAGGYGRLDAADIRSSIFYDRDNTGYYVDPNSNSRIADAYIGTGNNLWLINWPGYSGLVGYASAYLYPGFLSGQGTGWNQSYYLAGSTSWGLYTNTSLNAAGGLYDSGNRVYSAANPPPSVSSVTSATYATYINTDSYNMKLHWSGQSGQPTWLWGSNNGTDAYVWNPSNFNVNYANSAGSASSASYASSAGNADTVDGYHALDLERAIGGGFVPVSTTKSLGSTWNVVKLGGQYLSSDSAPAGGYVYKTSSGNYAALFTGASGHAEFSLTSSFQCAGSGSASLCARLNGSSLEIQTGAAIQVSYVIE